MKFIKIPAAELLGMETLLEERNLQPRSSVDGTEILLHIEYYNDLFSQPMLLSLEQEEVKPSYPIYDSESEEFNILLNSEDWKEVQE